MTYGVVWWCLSPAHTTRISYFQDRVKNMSIMPTISPPESSLEDVEALVEQVAELERTQQQEDVRGFLELFDPLAVWVTSGGKRLIGLDVIGDFTWTVLPGAMSDGSVSYDVEHVLF